MSAECKMASLTKDLLEMDRQVYGHRTPSPGCIGADIGSSAKVGDLLAAIKGYIPTSVHPEQSRDASKALELVTA